MKKKRYVTLMFRICFLETGGDICTTSSSTPEVEWDASWSDRW